MPGRRKRRAPSVVASPNDLASATLHGSPDKDWTYEYDPTLDPSTLRQGQVGNRVAASQPVGQESVYVSNSVNQYGAVGRDGSPAVSEGARHDADGNLIEIFVAGDMNCDNQIDNGDIDPFIDALLEGPPYTDYYTAYPGCNVLNGDLNGDNVFDNGDGDAFTALLVGAGGGSAQKATLAWDAENRLVAWTPGGKLDSSSRRLAFDYDWMGRRIRKTTYAWDEGEEDWETTPETDTKYVWDGWLLLMELDALDDDAPTRKYTWGLDLAGLNGGASASSRSDDGRTSAGGIGGLLALEDAGTSAGYGYFFDGNGNVGQVVKPSDGTIGAKYQYDPYGNIIDDPDSLDQPMRFSTKPLDAETGFYYYGYRYYLPRWGRWGSRDPLGEIDGINLFRYAGNEPIGGLDPLGDKRWQKVSVSRGPHEGTADAQFTVVASCCMCDDIEWVQLYREWTTHMFTHFTNWTPDVAPGATAPWYAHVTNTRTTHHKTCVTVSQFTDTPGTSRSCDAVYYPWIKQDFEACAVCLKLSADGSTQTGCVIGCVNSGWEYRQGRIAVGPFYNVGEFPVIGIVYLPSITITYGNASDASPPSALMRALMRLEGVDPDCSGRECMFDADDTP